MITKELEKDLIRILTIDRSTEEYDPYGQEYDEAQEILEKYDNKEIGEWYYNYVLSLRDKKLLFDVLNTGCIDNFISIPMNNPYYFCGFIGAMFPIDDTEEGDFSDDIITHILSINHLVSLFNDPYYASSEDSKLLEEIKYWKKQINK